MAEQQKFSYAENGWPTTKNAEAAKYTPEEKLLAEAIDILNDMTLRPTGIPAITKTALDHLKGLVEPVFAVVSDYSHMKARITELEAEVDSRDERISDLEEKLEAVDEEDDDDPPPTPGDRSVR